MCILDTYTSKWPFKLTPCFSSFSCTWLETAEESWLRMEISMLSSTLIGIMVICQTSSLGRKCSLLLLSEGSIHWTQTNVQAEHTPEKQLFNPKFQDTHLAFWWLCPPSEDAHGSWKIKNHQFSPEWEGKQPEGTMKHICQKRYPAPGNVPWSKNFAPQ